MRRPQLPRRQRAEASHVSGVVEYWLAEGGVWQMSDAVAVVHAVSDDPQVLGDVLGCYLARAEIEPHVSPVVQVLRAAGADEDVAGQVAAWQRWRYDRNASAEGPVL